MPAAQARSTIPEPQPIERIKRGRALRRIFNVLLAVFLIAAVAGVFGVRSRKATASAEGYEVTVTYAAVSRPGLATPWSVDVRRVGGFEAAATIAVTSDYVDMFDENGLDPDPAVARADADFVYWTFDVPPGETLGVSFDARIEPGVQWGREGVVKLIRESRTIVEVPFKTWVMP